MDTSASSEPSPAQSGPPRTGELREWLALRGASGERQALQQLFEDHHAALLEYVFRLIGDAATSEDVVSETILRAARARHTLEWRGVPLRGWLLRIATHELYSQGRSRRASTLVEEPVAPAAPVEGDLEGLRTELALLPEDMAQAIALHHLQELGVAEVARLMGAPEGTVKSWLARGRLLLRERLRSRRGGAEA